MPEIITKIFFESFFAFISLFVGVVNYKFMNFFWRLSFFQHIIYLLLVILGYIITTCQKNNGLQQDNQWVYNLAMILEIIFLCKMALISLENKWVVKLLFLIFVFTILISFKLNGVMIYANFGYVTAGLIIIVLYSMILYRLFHKTPSVSNPKIWLSIGLIIYFACIIPYFSLMPYLTKTNSILSTSLFHLVPDFLANIRYLLLAVGFFLLRNNKVKLLSD